MIPVADFNRVITGRAAELAILNGILKKASSTTSESRTQVCYIEGVSGSGKSHLARNFIQQDRANVVYCGEGKFDYTESHPFKTIAAAIQGILDAVTEDLNSNIIAAYIEQELANGEWKVLEQLINLGDVIPEIKGSDEDGTVKDTIESPEDYHSFGVERVVLALRGLLKACSRAVAKKDEASAVILFLDDVQWAPEISWDILKKVLHQQDNNTDQTHVAPLIFLGTHRSVPQPHWHDKIPPDQLIVLGDLTLQDVQGVLYKLFRREDTGSEELAKLILRKNSGNAFFVMECIRMLLRSELITFSVQTLAWAWNCETVRAETSLSDDQVNLVASRIQASSALPILKVLACLEVTFFDVFLVNTTITAFGDMTPEQVEECLEAAIQDDLIEKVDSVHFKVTHDKIRETAQMLLPTGSKLDALNLKVGRLLYKVCDMCPHLHVICTRQLNKARHALENNKSREELADLNLTSARHFMKQAAFFPAVELLKIAEELVGPDLVSWNKPLMMGIQNDLALALFNCGRLQESIEVANTVIDRANTYEEKEKAYHLKIQSIAQQGDLKKAFSTTVGVIKELGVSVPTRFFKFHTIRLFLNVSRRLKRKSREDLLNLPFTTNERLLQSSDYLIRMGELAVATGNDDLLGVVILMALQTTLDHGRHLNSPLALLGFGMILIEQGDFENGRKWGEVAKEMAEQKMNSASADLRVVSMYYYWISHWKAPFHDGLEPFQKIMQSLWDSGSLHFVFFDSSNTLRTYFACGLNLEPLMKDCSDFNALLKDYRQETSLNQELPMIQMVDNLAGRSTHTVELTGDYMKEAELIEWAKSNHQDGTLEMLYLHKVMTAIYFEDDATIHKHIRLVRKMFLQGCETYVSIRHFYKGVGGFLSKKHRKIGVSMLKIFKKWVKGGNVNAHHMLMILTALDMCDRRGVQLDDVRQAFDKAIVAAGRLGFLHHQALANHLAGRYFADKDQYLSSMYILEACTVYSDWGACGVASFLESKYNIKQRPSSISESGNSHSMRRSEGHLAKSRMSDMSSQDALKKGQSILQNRISNNSLPPSPKQIQAPLDIPALKSKRRSTSMFRVVLGKSSMSLGSFRMASGDSRGISARSLGMESGHSPGISTSKRSLGKESGHSPRGDALKANGHSMRSFAD